MGHVMSLRDRFAAVVAAHENDLAAPALEIARIAYPSLDPAPWLAQLDELADGARPLVQAANDPVAAADALARFLFSTQGFRGNTDDYYDPRNSFLNDVLARNTGIPISLSVLMIEVARRCGLTLQGVPFPGHFLVSVAGPEGPVLMDPFHGGVRLDEDDLLARLRALASNTPKSPPFAFVPKEFVEPAEPRTILARMLRNLVRIWQEKDEPALALCAVDLLLVLTPDAPEELRTRGTLYAALECFAAAADDFRRYLEVAPEADDAKEVRLRLARLRDSEPTLH
jgi:regulator of sirC expression with transglutaminase-like and TPR domain